MIDIKTSKRNGRVIGIVPVTDDDELLMMTNRGKIQRVAANEINIIGRNTQGVKIMRLDDGDSLAAIVKVPKEDESAVAAAAAALPPVTPPENASLDINSGAEEELSSSLGEELDSEIRSSRSADEEE